MANKQTDPAAPAATWTVEELYDLIMYEIEPELLTPMIPELEKIYKNETKEEHVERMERYRQAFMVFYERFDMLLMLWKNELEVFRKEALRQLEEKVQKGEEQGASAGLDHSKKKS